MGSDSKPEKEEESPDRILVTRAILEEVKSFLGYARFYSDEQMLASLRQVTGRPVELVEEVPDDEEVVTICSLVPVVPGSLTAECSECGATVYHSRNAPQNSRKLCTRCGPRLGH
jgi:hypothetical protein